MLEEIKQNQDDFPVWRRRLRKSSVYTCSCCKYESKRKFNVLRHQERIHSKKKLHFCCGKKLLTKGDYYIHCEKYHPETRLNAITSRIKYKMTSDSLTLVEDDEVEKFSSSEEEGSLHGWQLDRRYSERIRMKREKDIQSRVSLRYKVTYNDLDMENIPLQYFLTDRRLKPYMKRRLSASSGVNKTDETPSKDSQQSMEIAISSEQDTENAAFENGVQKIRDSVELPTKKLILQRFRKSVTHKFGIPLREQNNNDPGQVNFAEATTKKSVSLQQNWLKNVSTFALSFEQQVDIQLDRSVTMPVATQLHRDFLAAIDFDQYKIF